MPKPFRHFYSILFAAVIVTAGVSITQAAEDKETKDTQPNLSDKIGDSIKLLQPLFDQKKWDEVISTIDGALDKVEPKSLDRAFLLQLKVQALANKGDNASSAEALESALKIGDSLNLWRFPKLLPIPLKETLVYLSSFAVQDAQAAGKSVEAQRAAYARAYKYVRRLVDLTPHPAPEHQSLLAQVLYYQALVEPGKVDTTLLKQASVEVENALLVTLIPKEEMYTLQLAIYQQLGENEKASELIELLLAKFPNDKNLWMFLFNTYLAQQGQDLRAILTLERAQAQGLMRTPKDNFTLAALYYNAQQFYRAAELIKEGIKTGDIESIQKNWELWADCYVRLGLEDLAVTVYKDAATKFPTVGNFDLQVGQIYYNHDNQEQALKFMRTAVAKNLDNNQRAQTYYFIAFLSLELKRLDDALVAAQKAVDLDPRSKTNKTLLEAITKSIDSREAFKKS